MAQLLSVRQYQRGPSHHKTRRKERQFRRRQDRLLVAWYIVNLMSRGISIE